MTAKCDQLGAGEAARAKLLDAALDLFGQRGIEGVSIRQISDLAGMNVASISYHFGSKQGLYSAVADKICEQRAKRDRVSVNAAQRFIESKNTNHEDALKHILLIAENIIDVIVPDSVKTEKVARFIARFQFSEHIPEHDLTKSPLHDLLAVLIGIARDKPDAQLENSIIAQSIFGQILVFRVNRLSSKQSIGISKFGATEVAQIKQVVFSNIRKILS